MESETKMKRKPCPCNNPPYEHHQDVHSPHAQENSEPEKWKTTERGLDIGGGKVFAMSAPKADAIRDAHNAALSAEKDKNFAAEKELRDKARARIDELLQQLADERENIRQRAERMQQLISENVVIRKQLAAERKLLVHALKRIATGKCDRIAAAKIAAEALAKVK